MTRKFGAIISSSWYNYLDEKSFVNFFYILKRRKMKILKELEEIKLVIVEMEVNLGKDKRKGLTLCAKDENGYYPLNTAHDGRPILMNKENLIKLG